MLKHSSNIKISWCDMISTGEQYVCIQGHPLNWAWSLKELGTESVGMSANGENPPPNLSKKQDNQILWAFRQFNDYDRLRELVSESSYVKAILVTTKGEIPQLEGGTIGFGEIYKDDLIDELRWEYWPHETGWNYKFFIRITRLGPKIKDSLIQLRELRDWRSLRGQIESIIVRWNESILDVVPKRLTQGSFVEIKEETYNRLARLAKIEWDPVEKPLEPEGEQEITKDLEKVITVHLVAGKNVIIYGPPGIGKTTFAKKICEDLTSGYYSVTGNPEWTVFDVIGGRSLTSEFRFGFLSEAVVKCWNALATENKPYWLLIDEINRANVDLAFGNAFTTMDLLHRGAVPLLSLSQSEREKLPDEIKKHFEGNDLFTPYSFRIVSTMNSYDRALLFKLGFALIRRFALIPMSRKPYILEGMDQNFAEKAKALIKETEAGQSYLYESAKKELLLCRENLKDFLVIKKDFFDKLNSGSVDKYFSYLELKIGFSLFNLIEAICGKINNEMEGAVEVGKAFSLDASKFLIAAYFIFGEDGFEKIVKALVDEAVAAYIIPQLDVLSEKVRAERMGLYADMRMSKKIEALTNVFSDMNLSFRTMPLMKRISAGEKVF